VKQFRVYDKKEDELIEPAEKFYIGADGETLLCSTLDMRWKLVYEEVTDDYEVSFQAGWIDRHGRKVWQGDLVKRVRDQVAEYDRQYAKEQGIEDVEEYVQNDKSGAVGLVTWNGTEFRVKLLEGHKWAFYGPEGQESFWWEEDIDIIGNKWNTDLSQYDRSDRICS
jgi:hypothetical protein